MLNILNFFCNVTIVIIILESIKAMTLEMISCKRAKFQTVLVHK